MKKEKIDLEADQNDPVLEMDYSASCFDTLAMKLQKQQHKMGSFQLTNDMSQTLSMFRKYLFSKPENNIIGKTNMEEYEVIKKRRSGLPLLPPKLGSHMPRCASFLEQKLLPGLRTDAIQSQYDGKSSAAQLTIFFAGDINVYDNVPADKAQAIMLLAGKISSMSKPIALELPETEMKNLPFHHSNSTSVSKLQADTEANYLLSPFQTFQLQESLSLQHFLEKRRSRITSKAPYFFFPRVEVHEKTETRADNDDEGGLNAYHSISLSPFPSRLGNFSPTPANNKGR